jgi:hypothetical protein
MNGGSLVELPGLNAISIRGPWWPIPNELSAIPPFIPKSTDSASTLPYAWLSNQLFGSIIVDAFLIADIKQQPESYVFSIFTTDCPSGAMYARLNKLC